MKFTKNYEPQQRIQITNNLPSMVKPEFELELEINNIMDRYTKTGYLPAENVPGIFGDFSIPQDFSALQDKLLNARAAFINLPLDLRDHYRTAESLINALSDPHEKSRLQAFGVLQNNQVDPAAERGQQAETSESASVSSPDKGQAS